MKVFEAKVPVGTSAIITFEAESLEDAKKKLETGFFVDTMDVEEVDTSFDLDFGPCSPDALKEISA